MMNLEDFVEGDTKGKKPPSQEKPCRACTDFGSWVRTKRETAGLGVATCQEGQKNNNNEQSPTNGSHSPKEECPLDKDNLGRHTWSFLHTMAAYYPDQPSQTEQKEMSVFMKILSKYYPCDHCARDFREEIRVSPPNTTSRIAFSLWLCQMHNIVNRKLGKSEFDCSLVDERWKDGWSSGVCDE